jgi:Zn-dependent protease with chaperone function
MIGIIFLVDDRVKSSAVGARNLAAAFARYEVKLNSNKPSLFKRFEMWMEHDSEKGWIRKKESPFSKLGYDKNIVGFTGLFDSLISTHPSPMTRIRRLLDLDRSATRDFISRKRSSLE